MNRDDRHAICGYCTTKVITIFEQNGCVYCSLFCFEEQMSQLRYMELVIHILATAIANKIETDYAKEISMQRELTLSEITAVSGGVTEGN